MNNIYHLFMCLVIYLHFMHSASALYLCLWHLDHYFLNNFGAKSQTGNLCYSTCIYTLFYNSLAASIPDGNYRLIRDVLLSSLSWESSQAFPTEFQWHLTDAATTLPLLDADAYASVIPDRSSCFQCTTMVG